MSRPAYSSTSQGRQHPDFQLKWVQDLLDKPGLVITRSTDGVDQQRWKGQVFNSMFNVTLAHESGLRASLNFQRPCHETDAVIDYEDCYLISLGTGLDGMPGRGHGGFISLLMDQATGSTAVRMKENDGQDPPATATMTVDYKATIDTPAVVLVRSWVIELSGRKVWVKGVIQDENGKVYAVAKALFIHPRPKASL